MDEDKIGRLIEDLKDIDIDVRRRAIDKLTKLDAKHAEAALHWAMVNDLDEEIRTLARSAYEQMHAEQPPATEETQPQPTKPEPKPERPSFLSPPPEAEVSPQKPAESPTQAPAQEIKREVNLEDTSHMAILEEKPSEPRNVFGDTSLRFAAATIALLITWVLVEAPHEGIYPVYVHVIEILARLTPIAGLLMAIVGITGKRPHKLTAQIGLIINLLFVVFSVIWFIRLFSK